jgi:hypothetical protein
MASHLREERQPSAYVYGFALKQVHRCCNWETFLGERGIYWQAFLQRELKAYLQRTASVLAVCQTPEGR